MFQWFKNLSVEGSPGLARMTTEFGTMLEAGRHMFATAANALLGGTDPKVIKDDLFATDKRINASEQQIRREIAVHAAVHRSANFAGRLVLMSIVKDAERIGDYAKNIYDLASLVPMPTEVAERADMVALKDDIVAQLELARKVFENQDVEGARELVRHLGKLEDHCDDKVTAILNCQAEHPCPATVALAYRYFKRIVAHSMNVSTTVFMPLDKIDYFDEKPRPRV